MTLDKFGCLGSSIKVASGGYIDLANPSPESIDIDAIASALSKICRFGGHAPRYYSVAEHCVHATVLASQDGFVGDALIAILLHDAAEAYIGDVVKPLKMMLPEYSKIEHQMELAVASRFGVSFDRWGGLIKQYDRLMLKAEKTAMWPEDSQQWEGFAELPDREVLFGFWKPSKACKKFMRLARTLTIAI